MTKISQDSRVSHRRLRQRVRVVLAGLRPSWWDADELAAQLNGWTLTRERFGRTVVRDPRFDTVAGESGDEGRSPVQAGRWL